MMKKIILILAAAAMAASCVKYDVTEILLQRTDISLTWKGELQMKYNPKTCQLGYNAASNEYRVYDDRLGYWFILRCSETPSYTGQVFKADVEWTTENDTKIERSIEFKVEKTNRDGYIWLWSKSKKIGAVIRQL
ncbi:MAG: hypothetical protein K2G80_01230 [Bacteroidales bacterium]|nr:hypothetical protein [Bacteroidales bacterium]